MSDKTKHGSDTSTYFDEVLERTLKNYTDTEWLARESILTTPYFLGIDDNDIEAVYTPRVRVETLRRLMSRAADAVWPGETPQSRQGLLNEVQKERLERGEGGPRYQYLLLDLRYLRRFFSPRTHPQTVADMYMMLNISRSTFHRHLVSARSEFGKNLLRLVRPSLRLELPDAPMHLVGREKPLEICLGSLRDRNSVAITGEGGVGKTTLGAAVAIDLPQDSVFWYTFRPGLNDDLVSVVFSIGHFLFQRGASSLWLQLLANRGKLLNTTQILGHLRADLAQVSSQRLVLIFDEIDLLQTASSQPRHGVHKLVLEVLEGLASEVPLVLIGQRAIIDTPVHLNLKAFDLEQTRLRLAEANIDPNIGNSEFLFRLSSGNPRLLELCLALSQEHDGLHGWTIRQAPALKPLFSRLWKRLSDEEKDLLMLLAVLRTHLPKEDCEGSAGLKRLMERNLIQKSRSGGVGLIPAFQELVYDGLPQAQLINYHLRAASIRSKWGQITSAIYHYWQSGHYEQAIDHWFGNREAEIELGNAGAAYSIFTNEPRRTLDSLTSRRLKVIRDELDLLYGNFATILEGIDSYSWHPEEELTATASETWAQAHLSRGETDSALERLEDAIEALSKTSTHIIQLHRRRGQMYIEQTDLNSAENEVRSAQYELERLKGHIEMARGAHNRAMVHGEQALSLAHRLEDRSKTAKANHFLAVVLGNKGEIPAAQALADAAVDYYETIGDRVQAEGVQAEMAGCYLNVGDFEAVIQPAERALRFFDGIGHELWVEYLSSNLAEAYYETGQTELAEKFALRVVNSENARLRPYALYTLGLVRYRQNRIDDARFSFDQGIKQATSAGDHFIKGYLLRALGALVARESDVVKGKGIMNDALEVFKELGAETEITNTLAQMDNLS